MFFDRLFTLTSLKARLLGSSSFAQLYSAERLPLHKFRREGAMLSPLIAGLLAACGGGGNDILRGGTGHDALWGSPGDDMLFGEAGNDTLDGAGGDDTLNGGTGADTLRGKDGADTFIFEGKDYAPDENAPLPKGTPKDFNNFDRILDYQFEDTIHFTGLAIKDLSINTSLLFQEKFDIILYRGGGAAHTIQVQFADSNRKLRVVDNSENTYLIDIAANAEEIALSDYQLEVL